MSQHIFSESLGSFTHQCKDNLLHLAKALHAALGSLTHSMIQSPINLTIYTYVMLVISYLQACIKSPTGHSLRCHTWTWGGGLVRVGR